MEMNHSQFFKDVVSLYDLFLRRCEPYARAQQRLSLDRSDSYKPLSCRYAETYCPQKSYRSKVEIRPTVTVIGFPSATVFAGRTIFLDFNENSEENQKLISKSVEKLKTILQKRFGVIKSYGNCVSYRSSKLAIEGHPEVYQEAGDGFIQMQLELVPYFRGAMNNLMALTFKQDFFLELDVNNLDKKLDIYGRLCFFVNDQKNAKELNVTIHNKGF